MAMSGLLRRLLKSPELMAALMGGGAGYLSAGEDDDPAIRALAGAALGGGGIGLVRKGARGLLGRVPPPQYTPDEVQQLTVAARRALGQTPQQSTQFPSRAAMDKLGEFGDMRAAEKYGDQIGMSGMDRINRGLDEVGQLGKRLWDSADYIGSRMAPVDRAEDAMGVLKKYGPAAGGLGALGGGAAYLYNNVQGSPGQQDKEAQARVLQAAGVDPTPAGISMFQAKWNAAHPDKPIPMTGQLDEKTYMALAMELQQKAAPQSNGNPPAPSLKPPMPPMQ